MIATVKFIPRPYQREAADRSVAFLKSKSDKHGLLVLPTGCHAAGTGILMFDGTVKAVEKVRPDDVLMGPDSGPRIVAALCRGTQDMYRITPRAGGAPFVVNGDHVLSLISTNEGKKAVCPSHQRGGEIVNISVSDYQRKAQWWKHLRKLRRSGPVEMCRSSLPIPPWFLGVILGDGSVLNGCVNITTADAEIRKEVEQYAAANWLSVRVSTKDKGRNAAVGLHFSKKTNREKKNRAPNSLMQLLRKIGIAGNGAATKHIPEVYRTSSIADRLEMLAGLMDTDGSHDGKGGFDFISKSPALSRDVAFIARSVGLCALESTCRKSCQTGMTGTYYRLNISGDTSRIPCRIKRKKAPPRKQKKNWLISGFSVEPVGVGDFYGFTIDGDHLYLTSDFTVHHNSGKSLVIAEIVTALDGPCLVFQPSREILKQNFTKLMHYGFRPAVYSASLGKKQISGAVTLATIGSVVRNAADFAHVKYVLVDEAHLVNATSGMYSDFFKTFESVRILGLTATPYRLTSTMEGPILKFLTRTRPRVFSELVYYVQNGQLFRDGHLAKLEYFPIKGFDRSKLQSNSTGADYTDKSVQLHFKEMGFAGKLQRVVERLLEINRKGVLVFTRFVDESAALVRLIPGAVMVSAETPSLERDRILKEFQAGRIRVVCNVGVLTTGFDYPELDTVVLARPTMSLALYYQMVGRCVRPHVNKPSAMVVDMVGLLEQFGKVEDLRIASNHKKLWHVESGGRQLTNVFFSTPRR